ncbi:MAG: hypothetical protein MJ072_01385, partial [Clostridia bacterium]|nr:hypothetical protein [Clostridia bacterium]
YKGNSNITTYTTGVSHHVVFILDIATKTTRIFIDGVEGTYKNGVPVAVNSITYFAVGMACWQGDSPTFNNFYLYDGMAADEFVENYLTGALDYTLNGESKKADGKEITLEHGTVSVSANRTDGLTLTATVEEGYRINTLKVNGSAITLDDQDKYTLPASQLAGALSVEIAIAEIVE